MTSRTLIARKETGWGGAVALVLLLSCLPVVLALLPAAAARADQGAPASESAVASTAEADTTGSVAEEEDNRTPLQKLQDLDREEMEEQAQQQAAVQLPGFFIALGHAPIAGLKADVRGIKYYSDLVSTLAMRDNSSLTNTAKWSWEDFRQQEKTSEKRSDSILYKEGNLLPGTLVLSASRDWSNDETLNNAGRANVANRDFKQAALSVSSDAYEMGRFTTTLGGQAGMKDQKAVNQNIHNDFSEASIGGMVQTAYEVADGLKVVGRVFGKTLGGDRSLGESTSPSSALDDTLALRVSFDRRYLGGHFDLARSHFEEEFLDFNRNSNGLIDTVGHSEADKIVEEMKTKNALRMDWKSLTRLGDFGLKTALSYKGNDLEYQASGQGQTERQENTADLTFFRASDRDSIAVTYGYGSKWDDQRIKEATVNRGKQTVEDRSLDIYWQHTLMRATTATMKLQQSLSQSIAENAFNQNDRDRVRQDFTLELERQWATKGTGFWAGMLFAYKSAEDISIRSTRSSNNNIKDSYEVAPGYDWPIASWLDLNQFYRVYIQYTDYVYSDLESVNKDDNYNKRAIMNTEVTIRPTKRLTMVVTHDYSKRFNATRTLTDATGTDFYHTDDRQETSKIDLAMRFVVMPGLTLDGATYSSLDEKEKIGTQVTLSEKRAGQVWVGGKLSKKVGPQANPFDVYVLIKKYYAYGPAVTETSDDYWEADVRLKWKF